MRRGRRAGRCGALQGFRNVRMPYTVLGSGWLLSGTREADIYLPQGQHEGRSSTWRKSKVKTPRIVIPFFILTASFLIILYCHSGIEHALEKHSSGSTGAFSGQGQTLGGSSSSSSTTPNKDGPFPDNLLTNLDPQVKVVLALLGAYVLCWYLS